VLRVLFQIIVLQHQDILQCSVLRYITNSG